MRLIYLDQSVLSSLVGAGNTPTPEFQDVCRILCLKLRLLKAQGQVKIVISDIHSRETAAIPDEHADQRERAWKEMNELADSAIANDWLEVFIAQQRRCLFHPEENKNLRLSDIGIPEQEDRGQRSVKVISTNEWRLRLYADYAKDKNRRNAILREILHGQVKALGNDFNLEDVVAVVRNGWKDTITKGIEAERQVQNAAKRILSNPELMLSSEPPRNQDTTVFHALVKPIVRGLKEEALEQFKEQIEKEHFCAAMKLRIALEAEILLKRTRCTSDKKFNRRYGISMRNDIDHVATFVPYCDAVTTDADMVKICEGEIAKPALQQYSCALFSNDNLEQLNSWIDALYPEIAEMFKVTN